MEDCLKSLLNLRGRVEELELFLENSNPLSSDLLQSTKAVFDHMKVICADTSSGLDKLLIKGLDDEQVWQEIEVETELAISRCISGVNRCVRSHNDKLHLREDLESDDENNSEQNSEEDYISPDVDEEDPDSDEEKVAFEIQGNVMPKDTERSLPAPNENIPSDEDNVDADINLSVPATQAISKGKRKKKSTVVDDDFFKLKDMNTLADKIDVDRGNESEEEIDYFSANIMTELEGEEEGDDSNKEIMYADFFDQPDGIQIDNKDHQIPSKKVKFEDQVDELGSDGTNSDVDEDNDFDEDNEEAESEELEEEESENETTEEADAEENEVNEEALSKHEREQLKMQDKIKKLEELNLEAKPWQQMGEADAKHRPVNSLLEEALEFTHTSVGGPEITEETTIQLEDIIKQRVKDQAWDDVVRKEKKAPETHELRKETPIDDEKSKLSLAEIYEKEYLKNTEKNTGEEEKEKEEHVIIKGMLKRLFVKLDALSNFHYTPKPVKEDLQVITNMPSIQMEEIAPVAVSDTVHLAPEEIFTKSKAEIKGASEKSVTDKKRERRSKKLKKKLEVRAKEEKKEGMNKGKQTKNDKKEILKSLSKNRRTTISSNKQDDKHLKSSSAVFARLQDEAKSYVQSKVKERNKVDKPSRNRGASSMKL